MLCMCVCVCFCLCPQVCCWMSMCVPGVCLSVLGIFFSIATTAANFISIYSMPKFDRRRHTHFPHKTSNVSNILIWRIFIDDFLPPRSRLSPRDCIAAKKKERLKHIYAEQKKCQTEWTEKHFSRVESGRTEVSRYEILKVIFQSMVLHYSQIVWPWVRKNLIKVRWKKRISIPYIRRMARLVRLVGTNHITSQIYVREKNVTSKPNKQTKAKTLVHERRR